MKINRYLSILFVITVFGQTSAQKNISGEDNLFERIEVDPTPPPNPWIKIVGDINNDGKPDIIVGGQNGPLVWYENPIWNKTVISVGGYSSVEGAVGDIDNDGDLDVIVGGTFWYENPEISKSSSGDLWQAHKIADYRGHDIQVADLDKNGKLDIVVRDQSGFGHNAGNKVILFYQISTDKWNRSEISCPHGEGLKLADLDNDKYPDVIVGANWYKNPGKNADKTWKEHVISTFWDYQDTRAEVADYNNDGRLDVCLAPSEPGGGSYRMAWYEAPVDLSAPGNWIEHIVDNPVETVIHTLDAKDMNGDGLLDIIAALMHQGASPQEVRVYFNKNKGKDWQKYVVSTKGSHEAIGEDLNGDGVVDIVGANWSGPFQPLELWLNKSASK